MAVTFQWYLGLRVVVVAGPDSSLFNSILLFVLYNSNTVFYLGSMLKVWLREFQLEVVMKKL